MVGRADTSTTVAAPAGSEDFGVGFGRMYDLGIRDSKNTPMFTIVYNCFQSLQYDTTCSYNMIMQ